jgi:hypothetical protein
MPFLCRDGIILCRQVKTEANDGYGAFKWRRFAQKKHRVLLLAAMTCCSLSVSWVILKRIPVTGVTSSSQLSCRLVVLQFGQMVDVQDILVELPASTSEWAQRLARWHDRSLRAWLWHGGPDSMFFSWKT